MNLTADSPKTRQQETTYSLEISPSDPSIYEISENQGQPIARLTIPAPPNNPLQDELLYSGEPDSFGPSTR